MPLVRHLPKVNLLIAFGVLSLTIAPPSVAAGAGPATSQVSEDADPPMEVTTDTPEYCLHLFDRVSEMVRLATSPIPRDVTDLATEGQRMCARGQTRGGIMRLRSALMIMGKPDGPAFR